MKKWLIDNFLPMWAKETVLSDYRRLKRENKILEQEMNYMRAYIDGLESGLRAAKRMTARNGGAK